MEHKAKMTEDGPMIDVCKCSCGWESKPYFDGAEYAYRDWQKHAAKAATSGLWMWNH